MAGTAAAVMPNLLDLAKRNGTDAVVGLIDETTKLIPEITLFPVRTIGGLNYKTRVRVGLPTVAFRNYNEGSAPSKQRIENRLVECYLGNPAWECDKAVADASEDGPDAFIAEDAEAMTRAMFLHLASQVYYGTANDAKGFPGLIAAVDSTMVVDAGGTTASTGSSVWGITFGRQDVIWVYGRNGEMYLSPVAEARVTDDAGNPFTAYRQELWVRPGLQVGGKWSVGRIRDLTADTGKGLTDDLLYQLLALYPAGRRPHVLMLTQRSLFQLRKSRTATNATGAPAPIPTEFEGIPLVPTEAITNTEALS